MAISGLHWLKLDIDRIVAVRTWVNPDLQKVEIGFADLMPGSGHGAYGFVNLERIEAYSRPLKR